MGCRRGSSATATSRRATRRRRCRSWPRRREIFNRLGWRQLEGWFILLQAQAAAMHGNQAEAATLLARGIEIIRSITFAPARSSVTPCRQSWRPRAATSTRPSTSSADALALADHRRRGVRGRHHPSGHGQDGPRPQRSARHRAAPPRGARHLHPAESADLGRPRRSPGRAKWRDIYPAPPRARLARSASGLRRTTAVRAPALPAQSSVLGLGEASEGAVEAPSEGYFPEAWGIGSTKRSWIPHLERKRCQAAIG